MCVKSASGLNSKDVSCRRVFTSTYWNYGVSKTVPCILSHNFAECSPMSKLLSVADFIIN